MRYQTRCKDKQYFASYGLATLSRFGQARGGLKVRSRLSGDGSGMLIQEAKVASLSIQNIVKSMGPAVLRNDSLYCPPGETICTVR